MAEAALSFAVEKLGDLAIQKVDFLLGVEDQVKWLKGELEAMQCFLRDAAEKQANNEIRKWISDIRKLAQDAKDAIKAFTLKLDNPRSRGLLGRCACFPHQVYQLDRLGKEIEDIRTQLKAIDERRERYGIQNLGEMPRRSEDAERRRLSHRQSDKHVVGFEEDVKLLLQRSVLEERGGLSIASIVGMGGIGKSTLARVVYNNTSVADRFDLRAWVVVSREFDAKEVIKELMLQLLEPIEDKLKILEIIEKLQLPSLRDMLHERLNGRRYFIVIDDVWKEEDWESLASAFPDEQDKASRLLLTSRNRDVPSCARYVHELKTLDDEKSWELFLKKAFVDNTDGKCPKELGDIGREILRKCAGLPLAITVVGGLLVKQGQSKSGWEKVLKGMNSHLGRGGSSVSAILELSYQDLPPHLKSCFLCLGFFKEDATIHAEKLVHIWIAEGLVPQEEGEETMEEIATGYLDELINRNMVQVKDTSMDDKVEHYKIHDLLRELSIRKAKEEISFEILSDVHRGNNITQPRHQAIYCSSTEMFSTISSMSPNKHLRSLFIHGVSNVDDISSYNWNISGLLLRVLDMDGLGLKILPDSIGTLVDLRYLGLRNNNLRTLPSSLGRLKNLQVLDITLNEGVQLPNVLWKMDRLRHLYMSSITCEETFNISNLKNLQTLIYVKVDNWNMPDNHFTQMTTLGKLGIILDENFDVSEICTSLAMLKNLDCLHLRSEGRMPSLDGLVILQRLTQLNLEGRLSRLPSTSNFPPNLSYLTFSRTFLEEDPMPILEKLPKLLYLKFDAFSFGGEEMVISRDGFPRLKVLLLRELDELKNIKVGRGATPELGRLEIEECLSLKSLPEELKFMANLKELKMVTTIEIVSKLKGVDSHIISNIPSVDLTVAEMNITEEEFVAGLTKWIEAAKIAGVEQAKESRLLNWSQNEFDVRKKNNSLYYLFKK